VRSRSLALALALVLAGLLVAAPLAAAADQYIIEIQPTVETYNATISIPVVNSTLTMAANSSQTINVYGARTVGLHGRGG